MGGIYHWRREFDLMSKMFALLLAMVAQAPTPAQLNPPKDQVLLFQFKGKGSQIYVCQNSAWVLKAPDARLFASDGELAGKHFAGPTWEAKDGSRVKGKMVASVPSPETDAIPWLLVAAVSHEGTGTMASVQTIQRLETKGGKAPAASCAAGTTDLAVPYEAQYAFYGAR
jgi:hypothetical protein